MKLQGKVAIITGVSGDGQNGQARWPRREEIAAAVVFLASDEASGITGQVVEVPGRM